MSIETKLFYVYAYLDIRKPGHFKYGDFLFDFEPFYIGKGHKSRLYGHLKCAKRFRQGNTKKRIRNTYLLHKIINIQDETNQNPIVIKIKENLDETQALNLERQIIHLVGRKKDGGPLTNMTEGGDGPTLADEIKEKIKDSLKEFYAKNSVSQETRQLISKVHKGRPLSEKIKRNMSIAHTNKPLSIKHKERIRQSRMNMIKNGWQPWNKGVQCTDETKQAISLANKGKHHTEEAKAKISKNHAKTNKGKHLSEETKLKIREKRKLQVFTEESYKKRSESLKKYWSIKKGCV